MIQFDMNNQPTFAKSTTISVPSAAVQCIHRSISTLGYVLTLVTSLILWWGIYVLVDSAISGEPGYRFVFALLA